MRIAFVGLMMAGLGVTVAAPAAADTLSRTCARGEDVRVIEVLTPGEIGTACDLRYVRDGGGNVSVPYHANQDTNFCGERARALAASLVEAGYSCTEGEARTREASLNVGDLIGAPAQSEPAPAPAATVAAPVRLVEVPAPLTQPAAAEKIASDAVGASQSAMRGPVALTPTSVSSAATGGGWGASTAGKFVGATPDEAPIQLAAIDTQEDRLQPAAGNPAPPATESVVAAQTQAAVAAKPRAARDLVRAVLEAQVAAWNDGDLEAFMSYYWNSPNLRFVAGSGAVTEGWGPTMEHYRKAYGEGAALGQLACEYTHLQMLTPDVAVVVGKFELTRGERLDTGGFTLVVQRFDGVWRVVHDHSVMDPAPATE